MKFKVYQEDLLANLTVAERFTGNKDIISHVLIEAKDDVVKLTATNLIQTIERTMPAVIEEEGICLLPGDTLLKYIRELPKEIMSLEKDGNKIRMRCAKHKGNISVINPAMFPKPTPLSDNALTIPVLTDNIVEAIGQTLISADSNNQRPIMGTLFLELAGDKAELTGANGVMLSHTSVTKDINDQEASTVIPIRALNELVRLASGDKIDVRIGVGTVMFSFGNTKLTTLIPVGKFPDYGQIARDDSKFKITADTQDLKRAVKATMVMAKDSTVVLKAISDIAINVSSLVGEVGDSETEVDVTKEGGEFEITMNANHLIDALGTIGQQNTEVGSNGPNTPIIVKGVGDTGLWHAIMPIAMLTTPKPSTPKPSVEVEDVEVDGVVVPVAVAKGETPEELSSAIDEEVASMNEEEDEDDIPF